MSFRPYINALAFLAAVYILTGCASTTVAVDPSPQAPVCAESARALVLWAPQWRPDQKDVPSRETAAAEGIASFFQQSKCFASTRVQRVPAVAPADIGSHLPTAEAPSDRTVVIAVKELGPVVRLLSSFALVDGGTEVVLHVSEYIGKTHQRSFTVHWQNGGHGVIKGVATLPQDMAAALYAGMRPIHRRQ